MQLMSLFMLTLVIGCNGRISDRGVFPNCSLSKAIEHIMEPYPLHKLSHEKKNFQHHLSGSRRIAENAFRILASRFQIFLSPMHLTPENIEKVTLASCILQKILCEPACYTPPGSFDREDEHRQSH